MHRFGMMTASDLTLFGATETVGIERHEVTLAFKQVGNAINVPHAFLVLASGMVYVLKQDVDIPTVEPRSADFMAGAALCEP